MSLHPLTTQFSSLESTNSIYVLCNLLEVVYEYARVCIVFIYPFPTFLHQACFQWRPMSRIIVLHVLYTFSVFSVILWLPSLAPYFSFCYVSQLLISHYPALPSTKDSRSYAKVVLSFYYQIFSYLLARKGNRWKSCKNDLQQQIMPIFLFVTTIHLPRI